ncbi:hypothetical protein GUITHDRAFT_148008 [Guillardia theta CCMP2712]|uniref:Uncharacterized protein n=1 Tax=Guillardia theta (strain CCMP2712) TaxID=905079 RepID=L1IBL8_GUITC|nr:hypothetical protein GUITHDRAFT_148008 [Guillardia theta CCMP2712]EKX33289.1 hypothetical protein GUITHDRAFT_148008 [Guillardia theta CCMP2712]|eukprot:XP_005820269.1 hypothetical protein GUITHDRAFT_148008 [Guillardia theta CCMP2712]
MTDQNGSGDGKRILTPRSELLSRFDAAVVEQGEAMAKEWTNRDEDNMARKMYNDREALLTCERLLSMLKAKEMQQCDAMSAARNHLHGCDLLAFLSNVLGSHGIPGAVEDRRWTEARVAAAKLMLHLCDGSSKNSVWILSSEELRGRIRETLREEAKLIESLSMDDGNTEALRAIRECQHLLVLLLQCLEEERA